MLHDKFFRYQGYGKLVKMNLSWKEPPAPKDGTWIIAIFAADTVRKDFVYPWDESLWAEVSWRKKPTETLNNHLFEWRTSDNIFWSTGEPIKWAKPTKQASL